VDWGLRLAAFSAYRQLVTYRLILAGIVALLLSLSGTAHADTGHGRQFGFRAAFVTGYNINLRYDDSPYCRAVQPGKEPAKVCGYGAPLGLDLALSFAPLDFLEPFLWFRLGLQNDKQTGVRPLRLLGAGARLYTSSASRFKIYVEPALAIELQDGGRAPNSTTVTKKDLIFHLAAGPQFDITRHIGVFADAGLTVGVFRSIHSSFELKLGAQVRFP